jgi:hypothetical protein
MNENMFPVGASEDAIGQKLGELRYVVGEAITRFSEVEYITYECLRLLFPEKAFSELAKLFFAKRADLVISVLKPTDGGADKAPELIAHLRSAKKLAEVRNEIAHNPIHVSIYEEPGTGDMYLEWQIHNTRAERYRGDEAIREFVRTVSSLLPKPYKGLYELRRQRGTMPRAVAGSDTDTGANPE